VGLLFFIFLFEKKKSLCVKDYVSESSTVIGGQLSSNVGFRFAAEPRYYNLIL